MTITIISLSYQPLIIDMVTPDDHKFIASLFTKNDAGEVFAVQIADKSFKSRLSIFDALHRKYRKVQAFLSQIPDRSKFLLVDRSVKDSMEFAYFHLLVNHLNGGNLPQEQLHTIANISNMYSIFTFDGCSKHQVYKGESDKNKRVCRFCGKSIPEVSFSNKSHAVSEFLGNKSLICNDECDDCNERFSRTIEPDIANMVAPLLTINAISGKHGVRKTTGKNFKLSLDKSTATTDNIGTLKFILEDDFPSDVEAFLKYGLKLDTSNLTYRPQNIYKCLCKYIVSLLEPNNLSHFTKTIQWINSDTTYCKLPMMAVCNTDHLFKAPHIIISIRNNDNKHIPYCIGVVFTMTNAFAFILPFTTEDKWSYTTESQRHSFLNLINELFKGYSWTLANFSSSRKTYLPMSSSITIQDDKMNN